jgi:uncharacterized protein
MLSSIVISYSIKYEKMNSQTSVFNEQEVLHTLKHHLPAQAPLKDFIHHNTLHAFQHMNFNDALRHAAKIFGYKTSLSINEYRELFLNGKISEKILEQVVIRKTGRENLAEWKNKLLFKRFDMTSEPRVGCLRSGWDKHYNLDLDLLVHPTLFRTICSYLDQGISIWNFPVLHKGFLNSLREMEKNTFSSFFRTQRAKDLLMSRCKISDLLKILVGDESLYEHYLFDQQFAHQGWSGIVAVIEDHPETLLDSKRISLKDFIIFELLLEIDALDHKFGEIWSPLVFKTGPVDGPIFADVPETEGSKVMSIWQEAMEWTYYDEVLAGLSLNNFDKPSPIVKTFQTMFCIDDRETSLRDYLEKIDPHCETFATPGFFGVEFYFQPEHGRSYTKQCPAPVMPKFLIKEIGVKTDRKKELHFGRHSHALIQGLVIAPTLGLWYALRLFISIFKPSISPATSLSFSHMDKDSKLSIEHKPGNANVNDLQVGFTVEEMATRVETLLKSIGLISDFAPLIYAIGHGASSANNPHYAAYNCGACCGRPGSVNARVFSFMANHPEVRKKLSLKGIHIPAGTQFVGGLHDTTRDEIVFYDEENLSISNFAAHEKNLAAFNKALDLNAKERARRFELIDTKLSPEKIHKKILTRSVSLFEPRPELNHATNALCVVGRRDLTKGLFLDRRAFTNSYDHRIDPEGKILLSIMRPLGPVCGGINLEYFFSRVDNQKMGAGTKLPHNVMGLFGVANGFDGDLRPGLPSQMIELHDPLRLLVIVEHHPDIVLKTIRSDQAVYEWYANEWVKLAVIDPMSKKVFVFENETFVEYKTNTSTINKNNVTPIIEKHRDNIRVCLIE